MVDHKSIQIRLLHPTPADFKLLTEVSIRVGPCGYPYSMKMLAFVESKPWLIARFIVHIRDWALGSSVGDRQACCQLLWDLKVVPGRAWLEALLVLVALLWAHRHERKDKGYFHWACFLASRVLYTVRFLSFVASAQKGAERKAFAAMSIVGNMDAQLHGESCD